MSQTFEIAVVVGSLRVGSISRMLATALSGLGEERLHLRIFEIGDLPLYNPDREGGVPEWSTFRDAVGSADAVLFVTPEYNRSVPGALKNAIDVGSRPYGKAVWSGKPAAIISISPGALGGFGANHHLRQSLVFFDMPVLQQPEAYLGGAGTMFDEAGRFMKADTAAFMKTFLGAFADWIARTAKAI